jgi:hypothetical protein
MAPFLTYKLSQLNINAAAAMPHINPEFFKVIYHKNDEITPHPSASLAGFLREKSEYEKIKVCEIAHEFTYVSSKGETIPNNHQGNLLKDPSAKAFFGNATKELLSLPDAPAL